jgi:hypothetical protein
MVWPQNHSVGFRRFSLKTGGDGFLSVWASKLMSTVSGALASKPAAMVSYSLASKPAVMVFSGLSSKPVATVFSSLASKLMATVFSSLASKLVTTVSPGLALKPALGFLVEPQNQGGGGVPGLGLKTGGNGLVIWASKSLRQFLDLSLKTKQALVCRLHHKTDRGRSVWDTYRDLAVCFG